MSIITGGLGGGSVVATGVGAGTIAAVSGASSGAAVAALPQLGVLPHTGGMSILMLATIAALMSVVISHVGTKLYKRFA